MLRRKKELQMDGSRQQQLACNLSIAGSMARSFDNVGSFKDLLAKVTPDRIVSCLHEIGLFYRL